jgi:sugar phosphate isomerase/epimerase
MDVFWVVYPGQDPVKLMEKYPTRFKLMHLKDLKKGIPTGDLTLPKNKDASVALGTGQMDWPAILKEAQKVGVRYYFIEDESSKVEEQLPVTLKYLKTVSW